MASGMLPVVRCLHPLPALALLAVAGCYRSHELPAPDAPCAPEPLCLEDAAPLCLRDAAPSGSFTGVDDPACEVIEAVATGGSCADPGGHVHIALELDEVESVRVEATLLALAPGEHTAGVSRLPPGEGCDPCGGGGHSTDRAEVGQVFGSGYAVTPDTTGIELVLLGRGARYRVVACAIASE